MGPKRRRIEPPLRRLVERSWFSVSANGKNVPASSLATQSLSRGFCMRVRGSSRRIELRHDVFAQAPSMLLSGELCSLEFIQILFFGRTVITFIGTYLVRFSRKTPCQADHAGSTSRVPWIASNSGAAESASLKPGQSACSKSGKQRTRFVCSSWYGG